MSERVTDDMRKVLMDWLLTPDDVLGPLKHGAFCMIQDLEIENNLRKDSLEVIQKILATYQPKVMDEKTILMSLESIARRGLKGLKE